MVGTGAEPDVTLPVLRTLDNFRDVAGPGYAVPGGRMRRGVLYRSNRLELDDADLGLLAGVGLGQIIDLREPWEVEVHPDVEVTGARWLNAVVPGIALEALQGFTSTSDTDAAMREHYRGFVTEEGRLAGFRQALASILASLRGSQAPQLFHCSAGKDRTGWLAVVIQQLVGASWEDSVADYVLTDVQAAASLAQSLSSVSRVLGQRMADILSPAFGCDVAHLEEAHEEVLRVHGRFEEYARDGLGLSGDDLALLRRRLIEV